MKNRIIYVSLCFLSLFFTSCQRTSSETWEDIKTAGRHFNRGIDSIFGKNFDSTLLASDEEFLGPEEDEFIPLSDHDLKLQFRSSDLALPQSKILPGEKGSGLPNLEAFQDPPAKIGSLFPKIYFETDDHVIRKKDDLVLLHKMAIYLKKNPTVFVCIEGHCDERASAAYNMALGTRRANHVRVLLIKQGVDFNRLYTVSFGKEKPISLGHSEEDWNQNRRVQFKLFSKK